MDDLLAALARYDSPTLANAIETFDIQPRDVGFVDSRIRCMFPELGRMVGYAATATIEIGGLTVAPGDLLHADQHGVLKIPPEIAAELPAAADRVIETEQALLKWVRSDEFDPDRLAEMRARH